MTLYDREEFFNSYAEMQRSRLGLTSAGDEARPSAEMLSADPAMADELRRPMMLLIRAEKR